MRFKNKKQQAAVMMHYNDRRPGQLKAGSLSMNGKRWTRQEEQKAYLAFQNGSEIKDIARRHKRSEVAIDKKVGTLYNKDMGYTFKNRKVIKRLPPRGDADGDGVPNAKDCAPLDPKRQGYVHDLFNKYKQRREDRKTVANAKKKIDADIRRERIESDIRFAREKAERELRSQQKAERAALDEYEKQKLRQARASAKARATRGERFRKTIEREGTAIYKKIRRKAASRPRPKRKTAKRKTAKRRTKRRTRRNTDWGS